MWFARDMAHSFEERSSDVVEVDGKSAKKLPSESLPDTSASGSVSSTGGV